MKFMKLGIKPDTFKSDIENVRVAASELATDFIITVKEVTFHLHKFPLLSKSNLLKSLATQRSSVDISDIPGGPSAFEICAKFCYGIAVTLSAHNVVAALCAAEYLQMHEDAEKGNLVYKIHFFLNSSIFRSWKDSIIVLRTATHLQPSSKIISCCVDSISKKACVDPSTVTWSFTYESQLKPSVPPVNWWVQDLCDLPFETYKQIIVSIKEDGRVPHDVVAEAVIAYTMRKLPGLSFDLSDGPKYKPFVESIVTLLPLRFPCGYLLKLLKAAIASQCGDLERQAICNQIREISVADLMVYDTEHVREMIKEIAASEIACDFASVVDDYAAEVAEALTVSEFMGLFEATSRCRRETHDGIYRAVDAFLKGHGEMSKSERKRVCGVMDCRRLSAGACGHAVRNDRLPLRVAMQILFFEQARHASVSGTESGSWKTSTTTDTEDDGWNVAKSDAGSKIKGVFGRLWSSKSRNGASSSDVSTLSSLTNDE